MTDKPKAPETPGMEEVSAKFVDAAEAAVGGETLTDEALSALWQEWQRLWEANKKAVEEAEDDKLANETFTALMAVEKRMEDMPAHTAAGVLNKLRVAGVWIDTNHGSPDEDKMGVTERLTLSALADLERMAEKHVEPIHTEAQELASAERERITALWDAYKETGTVLVARDGEHLESGTADADAAMTEAMEADKAAWGALVNERCHTLSGLLVKMSAFKSAVAESDFEGPPEVLFDAIVRDVERMAGEGMAIPGATSPERSPLFSRVDAIETPLIDAEGAVEALWLLVEDGKLCPDAAEPIAYLVSHLTGHIQEQRRLFDELFVAAGGSTA